MLKHLFVVVVMALSATELASAANLSCEAHAAEQKLPVAATARFIHKCQADTKEAAAKTCGAEAGDQKLTGTAKTRFVKKCIKEATTGKRPASGYPGIG